MLLSNILLKYNLEENVIFKNEKNFDYLGLTESLVDAQLCIFIDNKNYISNIKPNVTMVITNEGISELLDIKKYGICISKMPRELFFEVHNYLAEESNKFNDAKKTIVGVNCNISKLSSVSENNVRIGDNVVIEEFVVIREHTLIGDNTIIRSGAKIGGQGYEFKRTKNGILSVSHIGGVVIGNNVEIQYNTCVDRGVFQWDNTIIGDNCKIDNLVHIAHGVKVNSNTMIVANVGIGGRTIIGEDAWIGFASTIINGVTIGNKSRANIGSVVTKSIPDGASFTGNFAVEHSSFIKNLKETFGNRKE